MYTNIKENIPTENIEYTYLSIISKKLRVGIIGGGKASYIKAKSFLSKGCIVEVLSLDFIEEFYNLSNIILIKECYNKRFIKDKHLIIIATSNNEKNIEIKKDCDDEFKLYILASNFSEGMIVTPVQKEVNNISFAINTKYANPRGALMLANKIVNLLEDYDAFIWYSSYVREQAKLLKENKKEIIDFVCSEDFYYIYKKGKEKIILEMFFGRELIKEVYGDNCCEF